MKDLELALDFGGASGLCACEVGSFETPRVVLILGAAFFVSGCFVR